MKRLLARGGPLGVFAEYPILARLAMISVCAEIAWATLLAVMEFYLKEDLLHDEPQQIIASRLAMALLAFVGMETVFKYPMGRLADKVGARPLVLMALGISSVTPFLMYFFGHEWWHFLPLRALDGFAAASLWPAMSALMARAVPRHAKSAAMSVLNAAYCLGLAVGPIFGLALGHLLSSKFNLAHGNIYVFPVCGFIMAIGFVVAYVTLGVKPADESSTRSAQGGDVQSGSASEVEEAPTNLLRGHPMLFKMMALYAVSQVGIGILAPVLPSFIDTQFGLKQKDLSTIMVAPALLIVLIALPLGRAADHIGRARSIWISYAMATAGMVLAALSGLMPATRGFMSIPLAIFGLGMLLLIGSYILGTPAWLGLSSLQVDDSKQARALSLMQTAQGIGVVCAFALVASGGHLMTQWKRVGAALRHNHLATPHATLSTPKLLDTVPIGVWFWVSAAVFALCLVGTLLWIREPPHDENHADSHDAHHNGHNENGRDENAKVVDVVPLSPAPATPEIVAQN